MTTHLAFRRPRALSARAAALVLAAGASLALAGPASAQQFKITATGTVTKIQDDAGLYNSSVAIGTPFTFSYLFDYSAVDTVPADPANGLYRLYGVGSGATVSFGDYQFTPGAASVHSVSVAPNTPIAPSVNVDYLNFDSHSEPATGFGSPRSASYIQVGLSGPAGQFLTSDALPPLSVYTQTGPTAPNFSTFVVAVRNDSGVFSYISGQNSLTSLKAERVSTVDPVPEASTTVSLGVMVGLGGLAMAFRARRRSRA